MTLRLLLLICLMLPSFTQASEMPRVTATLSSDQGLVGQAITLHLKVLVPTWMPSPPDFPPLDMLGLIVRLPPRAAGPVSETIEGTTWSGVQRRYRLYPLEARTFTLPPRTVRVTTAQPGAGDPVVVHDVPLPETVFEATVPVAARALKPLIIADRFTLTQHIEPQGSIDIGGALVRTIRAHIDGTTPILIPPLNDHAQDPLWRVYSEDPRIEEKEERGLLSGTRTETLTYLAVQPGTAMLPPLALSWFNRQSGQVETVTLDAVTVEIRGKSAPLDLGSVNGHAMLGALVALLMAFYLGRLLAPRWREWLHHYRQSERHAHRQMLRALRRQDLNAMYRALDHWASLTNPETTKALHPSLSRLGRSCYGTGDGGLHTTAWRELKADYLAVRRRLRQTRRQTRHPLPDLNPGA